MAIVRPGPYICSEWEFGGLPWWIQADEDIEIRCMNKAYIKHFDRYLDRMCDEIRPLLCTNGGNVIMVQCENEYGYYGDDKEYLNYLKEGFMRRGIDVPLFTSDGTSKEDLLDGTIDGCLATLNFGSRVEENFKAHDELYPDSPKMCMEMWNGWFDAWGDEKHHTTSAEVYAKVVDDMLKRMNISDEDIEQMSEQFMDLMSFDDDNDDASLNDETFDLGLAKEDIKTVAIKKYNKLKDISLKYCSIKCANKARQKVKLSDEEKINLLSKKDVVFSGTFHE